MNINYAYPCFVDDAMRTMVATKTKNDTVLQQHKCNLIKVGISLNGEVLEIFF